MIDFDEYDPFGAEAGFVKIEPCLADRANHPEHFNEQEQMIYDTAKNGKVSDFIALKGKGIEFDLDECLSYAAHGDNAEMVRHLIQVEGAKPTYEHCHTTLEWACFAALDELLTLGADPHAHNDALIYHAAALNYGALNILARHGANNYTPILNQFIESDMTDVAIYMLKNGAEPNEQTLTFATQIENLTILKHLVIENGMRPPSKEWIDEIKDLFADAKQFLAKTMLHDDLKNRPAQVFKSKSQSRGMKI